MMLTANFLVRAFRSSGFMPGAEACRAPIEKS
jgi:hypothetical protein